MWQPSLLLKEIYEFEGLEMLLIRALLFNSNEGARKAVERTFRMICTKTVVEEGIEFNAKSVVKKLPAALGAATADLDHRAHEAVTAQAFVEDLKRITY